MSSYATLMCERICIWGLNCSNEKKAANWQTKNSSRKDIPLINFMHGNLSLQDYHENDDDISYLDITLTINRLIRALTILNHGKFSEDGKTKITYQLRFLTVDFIASVSSTQSSIEFILLILELLLLLLLLVLLSSSSLAPSMRT